MFKKSKIKIVASIMATLTFLWVGTLGVIFLTSYYDVSNTNFEMLKEYSEAYYPKNVNADIMPPARKDAASKKHQDTDRFKLSTFYSVSISLDGDILEIRNDETTVYTNDELIDIAKTLVSEENHSLGTVKNLLYCRSAKGNYILIAFMDNTILQESMTTLFRYTLVFGCVLLIVLFFIANYLADRIVKPLEESYEKQKQFISDAGHELKTPVSVVNANAEILVREIGQNQWLSNIQYENERMGILVGQLLELARTERNQQIMERLDLGNLVVGGILPFESVAFEKGITIEQNIAKNSWVNGNIAQLGQLISILTDNAIQHGKGGKSIRINVHSERNHVRLSVINHGDDIPFEKQERLFERFYRADEVRNSDDKHYGLGLSIAKAIVTVHNGRIEVFCSNGLIEFRVTLPKA